MRKILRILNAEPPGYSEEAKEILQSIGKLQEKKLSTKELINSIPQFDVLIVRLGFEINRKIIDAGKKLKVIVTATTGLDHIDVDYSKKCGIEVLSLKGEIKFLRNIPATAEHTWALILSLIRRIPWAFEYVKAGNWNRDAYLGHDIYDRRLGILGLGRLGEKIAHYGNSFGMKVLAFSPFRERWPSSVHQCSSLDDLLCRSDVLSIHVPLSEETCHMIGHRELSLLPKGAFVINTARGAIMDEIALVDALKRRHIGGAALDVIEDERNLENLKNSSLLEYAKNHNNLLITPHIGGATHESMRKTEVFMAKKLKIFLRDRGYIFAMIGEDIEKR